MWNTVIYWLEEHIQPCMYKKNLGFECPGCGLQRSFVELLKGNLWESMKLYPALIPIVFMFMFLALHISFKIKNGAQILIYLFIFNTGIVITSYFLKLIQ